ncbi:MAG: hypothetical protein ABR581_11225 [Thermoleophilaceae bacterium]
MRDLVCEACERRWHSAASADVANERGGCLHCGGRLRGLTSHPASPPLAVLRAAEEPGAAPDDWAA